ncbi:hypothetical protein [Neobacillus endophyticus]|uniref:hypothetical protein n=1 Tax=Neobacillus endophyticus TaxID=2738405 RepID=UPI001C279FF4|nr:hypothetical protein [Neobacillus endophyticus]
MRAQIITGDDYKAKNDVISLYSDIRNSGTVHEYIDKQLWCENCGNYTEFED